ncbi:MAG: PIN domain-containing protein [Chthoniobacteraceae bacterium]
MPTFLDTGAIYALADRNDLDHAAVKGVYADLERRFVTHGLILVEAFSLLTKRLHKQAALTTIRALRCSPRVEIVPVSPGMLEAAWIRCERFADKEWDWIDCTSFGLMEQRGLREALCMDHHFTQAGFVLLA